MCRFTPHRIFGAFLWLSIATASEETAEIDRLIRDLGARDVKSREAATQRLIEIGEPARPSTEKASREANDLEIRSRARMVLEAVNTQKARHRKVTAWIPVAGYLGSDDTTGKRVHEILEKNGIPSIACGSYGYTLSVPDDQADKAREILEESSRQEGLAITLIPATKETKPE